MFEKQRLEHLLELPALLPQRLAREHLRVHLPLLGALGPLLVRHPPHVAFPAPAHTVSRQTTVQGAFTPRSMEPKSTWTKQDHSVDLSLFETRNWPMEVNSGTRKTRPQPQPLDARDERADWNGRWPRRKVKGSSQLQLLNQSAQLSSLTNASPNSSQDIYSKGKTLQNQTGAISLGVSSGYWCEAGMHFRIEEMGITCSLQHF